MPLNKIKNKTERKIETANEFYIRCVQKVLRVKQK